jgi:iron complex outermembrane receptor protein
MFNSARDYVRVAMLTPGLLVSSIASQAQTTATAPAPAALDEIVVTAQKRSENMQNVPLSVTAITAASLVANKIDTTQDLQLLSPSLVYNAASGYAQPFLRGIGSDFTLPNADPSVATYIDGAFVANQQATIENLLGVERVEVLEGPQGTLYGRNAVGGAISIYTLTPTQTPEGQVTLTTGNFARKEGSAYISGGITSDLAVGLYVAGSEMNPYVEEVSPPVSGDAHVESNTGVRLKAVYTPTDRLTLTGSVEATHSDSFDADVYRQLAANGLGFVLFPSSPRNGQPYTATGYFPTYNRTSQQSYTLREQYDFGWADLVGVSNYRNVRNFGAFDLTGVDEPLLGGAASPQTSRQYSQEVQLLSPAGSTVQWIGGLYFFHEVGAFSPDQTESGVLFGPGYASDNIFGSVVTKSYAAFGQTRLPLDFLAQGIGLTLGGRYTEDHKSYVGFTTLTDDTGAPLAPTQTFPPSSKSWSEFTPKVTLDYKINDVLYYATYSKGFKAGVYNLATPANPGPVNPETLNSYEIGEKARMLDSRLQVNSSAYYYDYKNLQVEVIDFQAAGATLLENAAQARAYGLESSLEFAVTGELKATGQVAWEHTEYTKYDSFSSVNPVTLASQSVNATGNQLQRAPKWITSGGLEYTKTVGDGSTFHASTNLYYNGGFYWTAANTFRQAPYALLNASVGYTLPGDHWTITGWGKNLTNRLYEAGLVTASPFGVFGSDAPPRMYGISAQYKF